MKIKKQDPNIQKLKKRKKKRKLFLEVLLTLFLVVLLIIGWKRNTIAEFVLENVVSKVAKADISLSSIDINRKGIYVKDLNVESKSDLYYYLETPKVNINLNYKSVIKKKHFLEEVVDSLYIETPVIRYKQSFGNKDKDGEPKRKKAESDSKKEGGFNFKKYVRKIHIRDASLAAEVKYGEYFGIRDHFSNANLTFDNKGQNSIIGNMVANNQQNFGVTLDFDDNGRFESVDVQLDKYLPDSLYVPVVEDLDMGLTGSAKYSKLSSGENFLAVDLVSQDLQANLFDLPLQISNLAIKGDNNQMQVSPQNIEFMGIPLDIEGNLISLFGGLIIKAKAQVNDYQIEESYDFMQGLVNVQVDVNGYANNLNITGHVGSDSLNFNTLTITDIDADLVYYEKFELYFNNATIDKNNLSGSAVIDQNFISANLDLKNLEESNITLQGDLIAKGIIIDNSSHFRLAVSDLTLGYGDFMIPPISGLVKLDKDYLSGDLANEHLNLKVDSHLDFSDTQVTLDFLDYQVSDSYKALKKEMFTRFSPIINGKILLKKDQMLINTNVDVEITAFQDQVYIPLMTELGWNLNSKEINISNKIIDGKIFSKQTNFVGNVTIDNYNRVGIDINLNDDILFQASDLLSDSREMHLEIDKVALSDLKHFLPDDIAKNYPDGFLTFNVDYSYLSDFIAGEILLTGLTYAGFSGYGLHADFEGRIKKITLNNLKVYNERQILISAGGYFQNTDSPFVNIDAEIKEIDFTDYQHILPLKGFVNADVNFRYDPKEKDKYSIRLKGVGSDFEIADFDINDVYFNLLYTPQNIHVDNLYLTSVNYADLNVIGDFSYDIFKNEFIPSNQRLYIKLNADLYRLLKKVLPNQIQAGNFGLSTELIVGINEEGLEVFEGYLNSYDSYLQVVDQPEMVENINILARMHDNKLEIDKFELNVGDGYLRIANNISEESNNFFVGNLILGQFRVSTSRRGLLVHIPQYMPKDETALIKISGRYNNYASFKGPFDDIKIDAEVNVSNASIIYPPNTENLLSMITSASKNTFGKKEDTQKKKENTTTNPLPFELDTKLVVGDNFKYVTYPTDITITPNSFLELTYKDNEWNVPNARFVSEEGSITFLDTDFEVNLVEIMINEIDLMIDASFVNRVSDGSTVTLRLSNGQDNQLGVDNLNLTLESDNPDDKTQSQVISRLRASTSNYGIDQQESSALQDETMLMLGSNVDSSFFSSALRPVEVFFRRRLLLDYFNIKPGFVKNMVNNYVLDNQNTVVNQEVSESELAQFSSSILLNNLSISFGRPIYKRLYFNYEGFFQETTNLNRASKINYDQDFELRTNIDFKTKMSYKYKFRPGRTSSHQVMLYHSINF